MGSKYTLVFTFSTTKTCCSQSSLALAFTDMPNGAVAFVALASMGGVEGSGGEGGGVEGSGGEGGGGEGGGGEGGGVGGGEGECLQTQITSAPHRPDSTSLFVLVHVQLPVLATSAMQRPMGLFEWSKATWMSEDGLSYLWPPHVLKKWRHSLSVIVLINACSAVQTLCPEGMGLRGGDKGGKSGGGEGGGGEGGGGEGGGLGGGGRGGGSARQVHAKTSPGSTGCTFRTTSFRIVKSLGAKPPTDCSLRRRAVGC